MNNIMFGASGTYAQMKAEALQDPERSFLITGAPRAGKTTLAREITGHTGKDVVTLTPAKLSGQFVTEPHHKLDTLLEEAQRTGSIVLVDEADSLFSPRRDSDDKDPRHTQYADPRYVINRLISAMHDGLQVIATSDTDKVDDALRARCTQLDITG